MRFTLVIPGLFLFLFNAFGAESPSAGTSFGVRFGMGWTQILDEALNSTLRDMGQGTIDPANLIPVEWGYELLVGGLLTEVVTAQTSNTTLTALSGVHRTRFVWNTTEILFGTRWPLGKDLFAQAGVGVGISKYLLQTYHSGSSTLDQALDQPGQINLVSSWNWTPVASTRVAWRFFRFPNLDSGLTLGMGVTAGINPLPAQWKLNDDVALSGLGKPWGTSFRYQVWLGIE